MNLNIDSTVLAVVIFSYPVVKREIKNDIEYFSVYIKYKLVNMDIIIRGEKNEGESHANTILLITTITFFSENYAVAIGINKYRYLEGSKYAKKDADEIGVILNLPGYEVVK